MHISYWSHPDIHHFYDSHRQDATKGMEIREWAREGRRRTDVVRHVRSHGQSETRDNMNVLVRDRTATS